MAAQVPDKVAKVLLEWFEAGRLAGFEQGATEGYQKGWDAATQAMMNAAVAVQQRKPAYPVNGEGKSDEEEDEVPAEAAETSRDYIVAALSLKPGMRPVEVVRWIEERHGDKVKEGAILQQIKRMRARDEFQRRDDSALYLRRQS